LTQKDGEEEVSRRKSYKVTDDDENNSVNRPKRSVSRSRSNPRNAIEKEEKPKKSKTYSRRQRAYNRNK